MTYAERGTAICAGLGLLLWGVVGFALVTAEPSDGADIGAGALGLLAIVLSILAADRLAASASTSTAKAMGRACMVGWGVWLVAAVTGAIARDLQLVLGVVPLALLVGCFVLALRLPGRQGE